MNKKFKKMIIYFLLVTLLFLLLVLLNQNKKEVLEIEKNLRFPANIYYKLFSYSTYYEKLQQYYLEKSNELKKNAVIEKQPFDKIDLIDKEKPNDEDKNNSKDQNEIIEEVISISSSLTGTAGVISVSGQSKGIKVLYLDQQVNENQQDFSFTAGATYTVRLEGKKYKSTITISSPSYATNKIISQLTLMVNPVNMTATIIGKLHLLLPGEIKGSLFNLTNSSSSSTVLKNGYFATSVMLLEGKNLLTASGQWFTIKLDLPSLEVIVTK